jgi:hypothetical protein
VRGSDGWRPLHTQRPPRPTRCPTHGPHASPGSESGAGSHPRNLGAPTPRPPVTRIVYLHRASAPPLASASLSHWTIGHGIRNPPQRASACTVRVLSGTSAPALSYAGRRASYTLQQAIEAACPVEGRRVVPGCPAPARGGAAVHGPLTCMCVHCAQLRAAGWRAARGGGTPALRLALPTLRQQARATAEFHYSGCGRARGGTPCCIRCGKGETTCISGLWVTGQATEAGGNSSQYQTYHRLPPPFFLPRAVGVGLASTASATFTLDLSVEKPLGGWAANGSSGLHPPQPLVRHLAAEVVSPARVSPPTATLCCWNGAVAFAISSAHCTFACVEIESLTRSAWGSAPRGPCARRGSCAPRSWRGPA